MLAALRKAGAGDIPVLGGGIIPEEDILLLQEDGIASVFTPGTPITSIIEAFTEACQEHHQTRS